MKLATGSRLGPYEIVAKLGEGGMGEVWRARDSHLGREVALKVLPDGLTRDPERVARFEREAKLLASLNHPNIAQIYGIEASGETRALVMELVEGPTLAERLESGPLPREEALAVARQVAEALEEAHASGIVHRDLKPSNVKIPPTGRVKVLDFGLARREEEDGVAPLTDASTRDPGTRAGTILGTVGYMAPEQVRGEPAHAAADLFAFGCLLFELVTGERAFARPTQIATLTAILHEPPRPPGTTAPVLPPEVERVVARCLEKDPERRYRSARELIRDLDALAAGPRDARRVRRRAAVAALALAAAALGILLFRRESAPPAPERAPLRLVQLTFSKGLEETPALSPGGERLAYAVSRGGLRSLELLDLESGSASVLTGVERDEIQPAWFPDGARLLFVRARTEGERLQPGDVFGGYTGGDVWELDLGSGRETRRIEDAFFPDVAPDGGRIAVSASWAGATRIWVTDANGSNPKQVTEDSSEAIQHLRPRWSPDGRRIVFYAQERTKYSIRAVEVESRETTILTDDPYSALDPAWHPSGEFVYFSSYRSGGLNLWRLRVGEGGGAVGLPEPVTTGAGQDLELSFAAGAAVGAFAVRRQNADLWRLPLDPDTATVAGSPGELVATTREDSRGAWSPDGREIAFNSDRGGEMNLWVLDPESGTSRQVTEGPGGDFQPTWSPDGGRLVFFSARSGSVDLWSVDLRSGALARLTSAPGMEINPFFSPDGERIAYQSDASGRLELWVAAADGGSPRQVTESGVTGHFVRWVRGGEAILYRCPCGDRSTVWEVPADGGEPRELPWIVGGSHLSLSPDGARILDVDKHRVLWISSYEEGEPRELFEFPDAADRIDYPVWSPDGRAVLFDRFRPEDGDLWLLRDGE